MQTIEKLLATESPQCFFSVAEQEAEENMHDLMNKLNLYKAQKQPEKSTIQHPKEHVLAAEIVKSISYSFNMLLIGIDTAKLRN